MRQLTPAASRRNWSAFTISLIIHISAISFLAWIDVAFEPSPQTHYNVLPFPDPRRPDKKVVWFKRRMPVPEVATDQPFGPSKTPQGIKDPSGQVLIARTPDPVSSRQLIFQPDHPEPLPADVPAPNLVSLPKAIEPPAKPVPKTFQPPPPSRTPPPQTVTSPLADAPLVEVARDLVGTAPAPKLPSRPFVAPPRPTGTGTSTSRTPTDLAAPPEIGIPTGQGTNVQSVVLGLDPSAGLPPRGSRSAQFSRAPTAGTPSSGTSSSATIVPGVTAHGVGGENPIPPRVPATTASDRVVKPIVLPRVNRTMSAPLRPSARVVPATVDAQFANRDLYTLIIPAPDVPGYSGDWVLWFAERTIATDAAGAQISAPIPAGKMGRVVASDSALPPGPTIVAQFAAVIDRTGHIVSAKLLRSKADPDSRRKAVEEIESWEFKPALRNGNPVDVDVVVEIPLQLRFDAPAPH